MYNEAIKAYNILLESKQNYYWSWDNLIKAYEKTGQKLEAAKACERLLKNKDIIARSGKDPMDLKLQAAKLYVELKHYRKATEHLQDIVIIFKQCSSPCSASSDPCSDQSHFMFVFCRGRPQRTGFQQRMPCYPYRRTGR